MHSTRKPSAATAPAKKNPAHIAAKVNQVAKSMVAKFVDKAQELPLRPEDLNLLYTKPGHGFIHPRRFIQTAINIKDETGREGKAVGFRRDYFENMVFDETAPHDPAKNNITIRSRPYLSRQTKQMVTDYQIEWIDKSLRFVALPPLPLQSCAYGPNGNLNLPNAKFPVTKAEQARYMSVLNGHVYDEHVRAKDDPYGRNAEFVQVAEFDRRLFRWVVAWIWTANAGVRPSVKILNKLKSAEAARLKREPTKPGYDLDFIVKKCLRSGCRSIVRVPKADPTSGDASPPESRAYLPVSRRVFAYATDANGKPAMNRGPEKHSIDAKVPLPAEATGRRRLPLHIATLERQPNGRVWKPRYLTRPEIDTIRTGHVMIEMVRISVGLNERNPQTDEEYPISLHLDGADVPFYVGVGDILPGGSNMSMMIPDMDDDETDTTGIVAADTVTDIGATADDYTEDTEALHAYQASRTKRVANTDDADDAVTPMDVEEDDEDDAEEKEADEEEEEEEEEEEDMDPAQMSPTSLAQAKKAPVVTGKRGRNAVKEASAPPPPPPPTAASKFKFSKAKAGTPVAATTTTATPTASPAKQKPAKAPKKRKTIADAAVDDADGGTVATANAAEASGDEPSHANDEAVDGTLAMDTEAELGDDSVPMD